MLANRKRRRLSRKRLQRRVATNQAGMTSGRPKRAAASRRRKRERSAAMRRQVLSAMRSQPSRPLAAAGALLILLLAAHLSLAPRFRVYGAEVQGNARLSQERIVSLAGADGQHVLRIDPALVVARLEAEAEIESASAALAFPARLMIAVDETDIRLAWRQGDRVIGVDAVGRIAEISVDQPGLIHVQDETERLRPPRLDLEPELLEAALAFGERFGSLEHREEAGFIARTDGGAEVWLGLRPEMAETQRARLDALLAQLGSRADNLERVDLRFVKRPYYRMRGEAP